MATQVRQIKGRGTVAEAVLVSTNVSVTEGCDMDAYVTDGDTSSFILGGSFEPAELTFDADSLRNFVGLAHRAIEEMDTRQKQHDAGTELAAAVRLSLGDET